MFSQSNSRAPHNQGQGSEEIMIGHNSGINYNNEMCVCGFFWGGEGRGEGGGGGLRRKWMWMKSKDIEIRNCERGLNVYRNSWNNIG